MLLLGLFPIKYRWAKYAGNWVEQGKEPISFTFQRWWLLRGLHHGPVTINGRWPDQPGHLYSFLNPSLSLDEVQQARETAARKELLSPVRLVFAGRLEAAKGAERAIHIAGELRKHIPVHLDVLGDGPTARDLRKICEELDLGEDITFHGWVPHRRVKEVLAGAHFIIHPSASSEGWPKVLSEAMAYGAVPVASNISAIPQILEETGAGITFPPGDIAGFVQGILGIAQDTARWTLFNLAGIEAAPRFTYERYLVALDEMFKDHYRSSPMNQRVIDEMRQKLDTP
jgi:glycosyltransferase involved in cell wall biosynthesis